jgi:hypothetical protein
VPAHRSGGQAQFIIPPAQELLERTRVSIEQIAVN